MLDNYVEKDLYRRIVLVEHLYRYSFVKVNELAELLGVLPKTIESDIKKISWLVSPTLQSLTKDPHTFYIKFKDHIPLYKIKQYIYRDSIFLQVCREMLNRPVYYLDIVEHYFVSVSKAYKLLKEIEQFTKENHLCLLNNRLVISEAEHRLLLLTLNLMLDGDDAEEVPLNFAYSCDNYIQWIEKTFPDVRFTEDDRELFSRGMYIAWSRRNYQLVLDPLFDQVMDHSVLYQKIKETWQSHTISKFLPSQEKAFIYLLFKSRPYHYYLEKKGTSSQLSQREKHIAVIPEIKELCQQLADYFVISSNEELFVQSVIRLVTTSWSNYQLLLPQPNYLLPPYLKQQGLKIQKIIQQWGWKQQPKCFIDANIINRFIIEYASFLLNPTDEITIYILTDSPIKFNLYKKYLRSKWLNLRVNDTFYQTIEEIKHDYKRKGMILCEKSYYQQDFKKEPFIIPIDLSTITHPSFGKIFYEKIDELY